MSTMIIQLLLIIAFNFSTASVKNEFDLKIDEHLMRQSVFYGLTVTAAEEPLNTLCKIQLVKTAEELYDGKKWALKLMDASGAPSTGLYWGGIYWLGSQNQCEAAGVVKNIVMSPALGPVNNETVEDLPPFPIAYYAAYFKHNSSIQVTTHYQNEYRITLGLCLPKSCHEHELKILLQKYFNSEIFHHQKIYNTSYQMESVKKLVDDYSWLSETKTIIVSIIILFVLIMSIVGTIFDVMYYQPVLKYYNSSSDSNCSSLDDANPKKAGVKEKATKHNLNICYGYKVIMCFSIPSNMKIIGNLDNNTSIPSIHGIRVFSMIYAIIGHTIYFMQDFFDNRGYALYLSDRIEIQIFTQAAYSVDSFFCISGYVLAHSFFINEYDKTKGKKLSILNRLCLFFIYIIKRFLRLTPSYMITLGIADVLTTWRFRNTPFWSNDRIDLICPSYWWRNLLYINNVFPRSEMCLPWSWYLSNDMQYFIVTSFFLILSTMYFYTATSLYITLFFGCIGYTVHLVYSTGFVLTLDQIYNNLETFYDNPLVRMGPYFVGVFAAYLMYKSKNTLPINKHIIRLLWIIFPCINLYLIFGLSDRENLSQDFSAAYMGVCRILWAMGTVWALIACETGNAGVIKNILCFKYWMPLSRLTYMAYLTNPIVIYFLASYSSKPFQAEPANVIFYSPGFTFLTFIISYILTLLLESPNIRLTGLLFDFLKGGPKKEVDLKTETSETTSNGNSFDQNETSKN